jgi:hypothetical protein
VTWASRFFSSSNALGAATGAKPTRQPSTFGE